jgi:hypothetical protein
MATLVEERAEELASKIAEKSKSLRDKKASDKSRIESRRADAFAACKQEIAALAAASLKTTARSRKSLKITSFFTNNGPMSETNTADEKNSKTSVKKTSKPVKAGTEPTNAQVSAMLEDLLMLSTFDIDGIGFMAEEEPPEPMVGSKRGSDANREDDDDEEEYFGSGVALNQSKRMKNLQKKDTKNYQLIRAWNLYEERQLLLSEANNMIESSIKSGTERDLRNAIKKATRAGMKWTETVKGEKKVLCTTQLKNVMFY